MFSNEQWWASAGRAGPHVDFKIWAAGGGGSSGSARAGAGSGGFVSGTTYQASGTTLYLSVGQGGPGGTGGFGGSGGGYSGVFTTSSTPAQSNALLIAGAGSGSSRDTVGTNDNPGQGGGGLEGNQTEHLHKVIMALVQMVVLQLNQEMLNM